MLYKIFALWHGFYKMSCDVSKKMTKIKSKKQYLWEKDVRSIQRHRKTVSKAQKWADLIGVEIKTTDDPILQVYNNQDKKKTPRWLVVRVTRM